MSNKVMLKSYEYQRVEKEIPFNVPSEPLYLFQTGVRRSIRVVPIYTTWQKEQGKEEEIWSLHITCVYRSWENKIDSFEIQLSQIPDIFKLGKGDRFEIVSLINTPENIRTKEQFDTDFFEVLKKFNQYE